MCGWVFVSVSFDEDNKRAIGILEKAIALFKLSMNEHKTTTGLYFATRIVRQGF